MAALLGMAAVANLLEGRREPRPGPGGPARLGPEDPDRPRIVRREDGPPINADHTDDFRWAGDSRANRPDGLGPLCAASPRPCP